MPETVHLSPSSSSESQAKELLGRALQAKNSASSPRLKHSIYSILQELKKENSDPNRRMLTLSPTSDLDSRQKAFFQTVSSSILFPFPSTSRESSEAVKEAQTFAWHSDKKYEKLNEKINNHSGYPWTIIKTFSNPLFAEQLVNLNLVCQNKRANEKVTKSLMDFAITYAQLSTQAASSTREAHSLLGQLIFLANQDPLLALTCIFHETLPNSIQNIEQKFHVALQVIVQRLQEQYEAHTKTQLQSPEDTFNTLLPQEISKLLMTDIGMVNVGLIDHICNKFLSTFPYKINENLFRMLNLLEKSPSLRLDFEEIERPSSEKMLSSEVIRTALHLSPDSVITDAEARQAALTALLSHLRQGADGSCFASSLAIEILSNRPDLCRKDLIQLIKESKLTRLMQNVKRDLPFTRRIFDKDLNKLIHIHMNGSIIIEGHPRGLIYEAPGIMAVCREIGIENSAEFTQAILKEKCLDESSCQMTIRELIKELCMKKVSKKPSDQEKIGLLFDRACFAFSSQTSNCLLKVWENTIANLNEAQESGMIKSAIMQSVLFAMQVKLTQLNTPPSLPIQRFFLELQKNLLESVRIQYDPFPNEFAQTHNQITGCFVLYFDQERIDSAEKFQICIEKMLDKIQEKLKKVKLSKIYEHILNYLFNLFYLFIKTDEFLIYILNKYHFTNRLSVQSKKPNYENLKFTPWMTQIGSNSKRLLEAYLEVKQPIKSERFTALNSENRLIKMIQYAKSMSDSEKLSYANNPFKLAQLRFPARHAGSLMLGHPSFSKVWQHSSTPQEWINAHFITPGKEVALSFVKDETKLAILKQMHETKHPLFSNYEKLLADLPKEITLREFRKKMVEYCIELKPSEFEEMTKKLDETIFQCLPEPFKKNIYDNAIHFGDTNWSENGQDLHFCFVFNPGTEQIEVWQCHSDGSHFKKLNQHEWVTNQEWEVFSIPE